MADSRSTSSRAPDRGAPDRARAPDRAPRPVGLPGGRPEGGPPPPDPVALERVVELRDFRGREHGGRRTERRDPRRRSREQREEDVLELVGTYRVISRRALVEFAFDGHPFAASRTLASLERRDLVASSLVRRGAHGYQVFSLTPAGRDLIAARRRKRKRKASDPQRYWDGFGEGEAATGRPRADSGGCIPPAPAPAGRPPGRRGTSWSWTASPMRRASRPRASRAAGAPPSRRAVSPAALSRARSSGSRRTRRIRPPVDRTCSVSCMTASKTR